MRVFENRVLRRIFGATGNEVTGEWRIYIDELYAAYSLSNNIRVIKSRRIIWVERRGAYRVVLGKQEGKRSLGRPRLR